MIGKNLQRSCWINKMSGNCDVNMAPTYYEEETTLIEDESGRVSLASL